MATETAVLERIPEALALSKLEAARMLGVSIRTVDRLIALKHLPVRRLHEVRAWHGVDVPGRACRGKGE